MVKVDLITGFLGSGKTTFIRKYAKYLMDEGNNIGILENDYGAVNVDMMLLQDLMGENCELEMISGGCDKDCHRRRFKTKLIAMGMCGYDRVIVEPSGIFDVDEFFDILHEEPLNRWYQIGNVIAIVDSKLERVIHKNWDEMSKEDFDRIASCGYVMASYRKPEFEAEDAFTSLYFMNVKMTEKELREAAEKILSDSECGRVFRMKGFMRVDSDSEDGSGKSAQTDSEEQQWIELNATKNEITIRPLHVGQEVLIVIGEELQEEKIKSYLKI